MSPTILDPVTTAPSATDDSDILAYKDGNFKDVWDGFTGWVVQVLTSINNQTLEHPFFISLALLVLWAWPHILMLPVWFGKDAYRRMDAHARTAVDSATAPVRRRRRDGFMSTYHSIVNASYEPRDAPHRPLFGGTPLSDGDFRIEEDRHLPLALQAIRWSAFVWAMFILGREAYFWLSHY